MRQLRGGSLTWGRKNLDTNKYIKKKVEVINRWYWSCLDEDHRHETKEAARKCVDRHMSRKPRKDNTLRDIRMAREAITNRTSYVNIGTANDISGQRVAHAINKIMRKSIHPCRYDGDRTLPWGSKRQMAIFWSDPDFWLERLEALEKEVC